MRSTPSASRKGNRFLDTESPDKQPSSRRPERPERVDGIDAASSESVPTLSGERGDSKEAAFSEEEARQLKADRSRHTLVFGIVVLAWLALDTLTKNYFNGSYSMGEVITGPLLGLVRFHLVHNTGAAWGMFGDSTFLLGVMSLIVCVLLTVYLFFLAYRPNIVQVVGAALVVAGGLGNAFDRFALGYVVDFIEPVFIDFPVFNVADIGVTCGFVLFLVGVIVSWRHEDRLSAELAASDGEGEGTDAR